MKLLALFVYLLFTFLVIQSQNATVKHVSAVAPVTAWQTHTAEK